jgi:hypothetical protein
MRLIVFIRRKFVMLHGHMSVKLVFDGFHTVVLIHSIIMFNCPSSTTNLTNGKVLKVK